MEWDFDVNFINCMNHVLNLAVGDFLKAIKGLPPSDEDDDSESGPGAR